MDKKTIELETSIDEINLLKDLPKTDMDKILAAVQNEASFETTPWRDWKYLFWCMVESVDEDTILVWVASDGFEDDTEWRSELAGDKAVELGFHDYEGACAANTELFDRFIKGTFRSPEECADVVEDALLPREGLTEDRLRKVINALEEKLALEEDINEIRLEQLIIKNCETE